MNKNTHNSGSTMLALKQERDALRKALTELANDSWSDIAGQTKCPSNSTVETARTMLACTNKVWPSTDTDAEYQPIDAAGHMVQQ